MLSSPGCWAVFGEVLAREFGSAAHASNHRLTVDAYAVQHPGEPEGATIRSVAFHLISLCCVLERGLAPGEATRLLMSLADHDPSFEWLAPPAHRGDVTVVAVRDTRTAGEHLEAVERWARSAWEAWEEHHERVRAWLDRER